LPAAVRADQADLLAGVRALERGRGVDEPPGAIRSQANAARPVRRLPPPDPVTDDSTATAPIAFDNSFAREMQGFFSAARPAPARAPRLLAFNRELALELGIDADALDGERAARVFSGQEPLPGAEPLAQAYAGHQFGHFVPQLGDGRALLLGEVVDAQGRRRDIQLKGSGPTHWSRGGDGLSPLGPVLREYVVSEAMHALGVPTTRALAAVATGETVYRDVPLPGAVFTRVAASHLRVGTFQYFAARRQDEQLRQLFEYAVRRHDPDLAGAEDCELRFLERVRDRQARLVAHWTSIGFVHGVMNTDNTSISGETIDFGPCAFMERYDPETVFSSIDRNGRYCFGRQSRIALWNLSRFAETLIPLMGADTEASVERVTKVLEEFGPVYERTWLGRMRTKLGLTIENPDDWELVQAFQARMHAADTDFTNAFRALTDAVAGDEADLRSMFANDADFPAWWARYGERLVDEPGTGPERAAHMRAVNPLYIPRNHKVEEVIEAAIERDDLDPFRELLAVVTHPFDEQPGREAYTQPAPDESEPYVTFCGT
jgi:serine/tyrosine/threonine adenylyltransferase